MATRPGDGRRRHDRPRQHPPGNPGPGPLAGGLHGRLRQQRAPEPRRPEDRRPPGVELVGRDGPDVPVLRVHARRRPDRHQAARVARLPRDPVPAGQPGARVPAVAAVAPRSAGVPQPHEGPGRRRLLRRPRGSGRRGPQLRVPDRDVRPRQARSGDQGRAAVHQPARRRRVGRGRRVGGDRRPRRGRGGEHSLGHRPQPPEPRPRHPGHPRPGVARDVRRQRLDE